MEGLMERIAQELTATTLEDQIAAMVEPLKQERDRLAAQKAELSEQFRALMKQYDARVARVDRLLRAAEPPKAKAPPRQSTRSTVGEEKLRLVETVVLESEQQPITGPQIAAKLRGQISKPTIDNALFQLRNEERIRFAGIGAQNAKLWSAPVEALRVVAN